MKRHKLFLVGLLVLAGVLGGCSRDPEATKRRMLETGNKYFERGKYKEASIIYRRALQVDMRYTEAHLRLGLTELRLGRIQEAMASFHRAFDLDASNSQAYAALADLYLSAYLADPRRRTAWLKELNQITERAEAQNPENFEVYRIKGLMASAEKRFEDAVRLFEGALGLKPGEPRVTMALVQSLSAINRFDEGEKIARQFIAKDPTYGMMYDVLYVEYVRQNRVPDAEQILQSKCRSNPKELTYWLQLAGHHARLGRRDQALSLADQVAKDTGTFTDSHQRVGDFLLTLREFDAALKTYEAGARLHPSKKNGFRTKMAETLAVRGDREGAMKLVNEILKDDDDFHEARSLRGTLLLQGGQLGRMKEAIEDIQAALKASPNNHVLRHNLGEAHAALGEHEMAVTQYEEVLKIRPDYVPSRYGMARSRLKRGEVSEVLRITEEVLRVNPGDLIAMLLRASAFMTASDFRQARTQLEEILRIAPQTDEARVLLARIDLAENKFRQAEAGFSTILKNRPEQTGALIGLAEVYSAEGLHAKAIELLNQEAGRSPDRVDIRFALAAAHTRAGQTNKAIEHLLYVAGKNPDLLEAQSRLGQAYSLAGQPAKAEEHLRKAHDARPDDITIRVQLALSLDALGRRDEAIRHYEEILKVSQDNVIALNNLAYLLAEANTKLDHALTLAQRAFRIAPNSPDVADTLGWVYIRNKMNDQAIPIYKDLLTKFPPQATWRYHLAVAHFQKGENAQARQELDGALKLKPNAAEEAKIRELLGRLGS